MSLSLRAYAKHRGVSLTAVQKAIKAGRVTTTADGKIDPEKADLEWKSRTDPGKQRRKQKAEPEPERPKAATPELRPEPQSGAEPQLGEEPEANPDDYWKSRAAREFWEAKLSKLKAEREAGNLIPREDAERAWGGMIASTRSKILAMPANLAHRLAAESDLITCEEILKDAAYRLLSELSEYQPS
jgi:hypothetical protein